MAPRFVVALLALAAMTAPAAAEFVPLTMMQNDILRALGQANPKLKPKVKKAPAAPVTSATPAAQPADPKPAPSPAPSSAEAVPLPRMRPALAPETASAAATETVGGFKAPPAPAPAPQFSEADEGDGVGGYIAPAPESAASPPDDATLAYAPALPPLPRLNPRLADAMASLPTNNKAAAGKPIQLAALPPADDVGGAVDMARLNALGVSAKPLPAISDGGCGMPDPVALASLDGGEVPLTGEPRVNHAVAATFATWVRDTVEPAAKSLLGGELTGLRIADSYNCRTRDHIRGAKLSEHAHGNAIDVSAFRIGKQWIEVGGSHSSDQQAFLNKVRAAACGPFKTVLGPGSDSYHAEHFHLDLAQRRTGGPSRGLYCK